MKRTNSLSVKAQPYGASYHIYHWQIENCSGSLMVETSIVLPIFVCFMVCFLFLFRVLQVQECVEEALQYSVRWTAVNCYDDSSEKQTADAVLLSEAIVFFEKQLEETKCPYKYIKNGRMGISLLQSDVGGSDVILRASYRMKLPVRMFPIRDYQMMQCVRSRKWVGDIDIENVQENDDNCWVYITLTGNSYHKSRSCRYLDLSIRAIPYSEVKSERNASGGKYARCESCKGNGGTVYITDYGNRYHSSLSCPGLKRTIQMVHLSEVGERHPCQKCYMK